MHFDLEDDVVERDERHVEEDIFRCTRVLEPAWELSHEARGRSGDHDDAESAPVRQVDRLSTRVSFLRPEEVPRRVALLLDASRGSHKYS